MADNIQHGIDDNPSGDAEKGAVGGAVGGAVVGALAGGPIGAVIGAVAGGIASGVGVAAVDRVDNDNTVTGLGDGVTTKDEVSASHAAHSVGANVSNAAHNVGAGVSNAAHNTVNAVDNATPGNNIPGVQTGGHTTAGTDTRGITEKAADVLTGDRTDDKTGGHVL